MQLSTVGLRCVQCTLILVLAGRCFPQALQVDQSQTTSGSPLSILQAAPKVRLDEPVTQTPTIVPTEVEETKEPVPEPAKKPGLVKGMIRAIPFLGPKIAGPKETPHPTGRHTGRRVEPEEQLGRVEDDNPSHAPLVTPGSGLYAPSGPTDEPAPNMRVVNPRDPGSLPSDNTLTVKVADAHTTISATPPAPSGLVVTKQPAMASVDIISTSSEPVAGPATPTLEPTDLGMPNPTYEQNEVIRAEYVESVKLARGGNYADAAQRFHEYAANHPSSGLAPRALFLAALLEPLPEKSEQAEKTLRERFPTSRFLVELEKRNRARAKAFATPTPPPNETPAQLAYRLESELTEAVGVPEREVPLRLKLGQAYIVMEEYDRGLEILRPAVETSRGRPEEAEILILISECYIATHRNTQAVTLLSDVLQRFPAAPQRPRALYDYGLVSEATGNFERARTMYSELRQRWPASAEAAQAVQRLRDMDRLAE